jgi:lipopolysaccharide assembly outer membrane protein LptD (OstA)
VNTDSGDFSSYSISVALRDDRNDVLRGRYTFVDGTVSQIEGNAELKLTDQLRAGAYGLYDANTDEFLQSQGLVRFQNSCNCWSVDLGVGQRINPDRRQVMLTFTFGGVGALRQGIGVSND